MPGAGGKGVAGTGGPNELGAALAVAAGRGESPDELRQVERVCAALPGPCYIAQAGAMPGRATRAVRLIVQGAPPEGIPALLERLRWPGEPAQAARVLDAVAGAVKTVAVSLDVRRASAWNCSAGEVVPHRPRRLDRLRRLGWKSWAGAYG